MNLNYSEIRKLNINPFFNQHSPCLSLFVKLLYVVFCTFDYLAALFSTFRLLCTRLAAHFSVVHLDFYWSVPSLI